MTKTAILVDGGFYRKRARAQWGQKDPASRADELVRYTFKHLNKKDGDSSRSLYRVFYYDCPPVAKKIYHPLRKRDVDLSKEPVFKWMNDFLDELRKKRKFALRLGRISDTSAFYQLDNDRVKKLVSGMITVEDLVDSDFSPSFRQKQVDMKLGIDVASLAYEGIVDQIILIAGDSDFVPAAKIARRKGIDFILDPMGRTISPDLSEHIDGLESLGKRDPQAPAKKDDVTVTSTSE